MRTLLILLCLGLTPATPLAQASPPAADRMVWGGELTWLDLKRGREQAQKSNKPILLVSYADW